MLVPNLSYLKSLEIKIRIARRATSSNNGYSTTTASVPTWHLDKSILMGLGKLTIYKI